MIAFIAGMFSVLTPCILPVLPALLVVSDGQGKGRVLGVVIGVVASFCIAILALTAIVDAFGIPPDVLRYVSATLLLAFALVLLIPQLDERFQMATQSLVRIAPAQHQGNGFVPGLLAGSTLGLVWAPCAGPILAGITSSIAREGLSSQALIATLGYGLGMMIPLTAVVFGGRALVQRLRRVTGNGRRINVAMGLILLATSILFFSGYDTKLNRAIASNLPFTSTPVAGLERGGFDTDVSIRSANSCTEAENAITDARAVAENGYPETDGLCDLDDAPALADDLGPWLNTPGDEPLTAEDLDGKVVLVDFWTYSCINCIRTLPYLRGWHEQYADDGLVILGVHTPEFAFERDLGNVRDATRDLDVTWPVALDNEYRTWDNFSNRFWPAKYLIDRDGTLRYVHYGEGKYDQTEQLIRELLDVEADEQMASQEGAITQIRSFTPETYVGYRRAENFAARAQNAPSIGSGFVSDETARYVPDPELEENEWALEGLWKVEDERAISQSDDATLTMRFTANKAYLVMSPPPSGAATVGVRIDGKQRDDILVDANQLYTISDEGSFGEHIVELTLKRGISAYAFTFG